MSFIFVKTHRYLNKFKWLYVACADPCHVTGSTPYSPVGTIMINLLVPEFICNTKNESLLNTNKHHKNKKA